VTIVRLALSAALVALVPALSLSLPAGAAAHEIPARVTVHAFVRPEPGVLRVIVRAPLEAMRDVTFPLRGQGYLDLERAGPLLREAAELWIAGSLELWENGRPLPEGRVAAVRVSLPFDRSFTSYASALDHVNGPGLSPETELVWQQALLDVVLEYPIGSDQSRFAIRLGVARLGLTTTTVLRFLPAAPPGAERAFQIHGDPGEIQLDPRWHQAALRFVGLGFRHILDGLDHLLFLLCLVIPVRRLRPLIAIVTSFTVAHSITLIASTAGLAPSGLWFPPLIETLIALSIVYMAFENIVAKRHPRRWLLAFGFGLIHGFGFSLYLRDSLQFAGAHLATSLLSFNAGVELGQLLVVGIAVPVLGLVFRRVPERVGIILISALVAHSAWHWMTTRGAVLREYQLEWPVFDLAFMAGALRVLMLLLIIGAAAWAMLGLSRRLGPPSGQEAHGLADKGST
jgi:hypothetical protein